NFDHGLQAASCHSGRSSDDVGLGEGRIEDAVGTKLDLQSRSQLEYSAFALHQIVVEVLFAAAISHIFSKHDDARVATHLVAQAVVNEVSYGALGNRLA